MSMREMLSGLLRLGMYTNDRGAVETANDLLRAREEFPTLPAPKARPRREWPVTREEDFES